MTSIALKFLAEVNPPTPGLERLDPDAQVCFMPLEAVWADSRLDTDRRRARAAVDTGYVRFQEGDILCPKVTPTFQAGRSAIIESVPHGVGAATTEVHVLRVRERADARYVRYALLSKRFLEEGVSRFQGVAGLQRVPAEYVRDFRVADVPLDVQRRIANFLDDQVGRIDTSVKLREHQVADARDLLASTAYQAVTGVGTSPSSETRVWALPWAAALPSGWGTPRVCQVARLGTGHTPSRERPELWEGATIPWLTTTDVHRFRGDEMDVIEDTELHISPLGIDNSAAVLHPAGTVALSRTASAGFSIIMGSDMATSQDYATWTCGPLLKPHYLLWCLRVMRRDLLGRLAMGSTHKTIYFPDLMSIRIPLPPVAEQDRAVRTIQEAAGTIRAMQVAFQRTVGLLNERKRSLITAAVTGEIDVSTASSHASDVALSVVGGGV